LSHHGRCSWLIRLFRLLIWQGGPNLGLRLKLQASAEPTVAASPPRIRSIYHLVTFGLAISLLTTGCGYRMGHGFESKIQSVYIPIFTSKSDRRGLEFQLTEAVQREIQDRTPFRIVDEPAADTKLVGKIVSTRKRVLGETRYDDPRELQMTLAVEVRWENLRTGEILAEKRVPISERDVQLIQNSEFAPEVGQSLATAYQQLVDGMARDIVDMMEAPTL
jgi:hypothetical protein